ncbi:hypothetical protein CYLTODRAFT_491655 [Cylindrobasidium torrendii FP15055 ss-10]|uniref:Uncharacterized protein n=1 Tax=Cylindrobasidium torrendii FP15055 ss-10 TaxID=1314674 RepID=A0A0D7B7P0_9AGAR|nr:hypothetical protein CYLTODRAFT_491655 [Cylindrobasidium torrendii FP15055 ss-10]
MATPFQPSILSRLALRTAETHLRTHLAVRATKRLLACNPEGVNVRDLFEHAKGVTLHIPKLAIDPDSGRVVQLGLLRSSTGGKVKTREVTVPTKSGEFSLSTSRPALHLSWRGEPKPQYASVRADPALNPTPKPMARNEGETMVIGGRPVLAVKEEPLFPTMTFLRSHVLPTMKQRHDVRSVKVNTSKASPYVWRLIERPAGTPKPGSPEAKAIEKNGSAKQKAKVAWNAEVAVLTSLRHLNRRRLNKRVQEMEKTGEKARY